MTQDDLGRWLDSEARRMCAFAHEPAHYIRIAKGESPETKYPAHLRYRLKVPGWETAITYVYSVDVLEDGRAFRHLSIAVSIPGQLTQGELNVAKEPMLELLTPMVKLFFPFADNLNFRGIASAPVPIVDPRQGKAGNLHFRTPVSYHFTVGIGVVDAEAAAEARNPAPRKAAHALAVGAIDAIADDLRKHTPDQKDLLEELAHVSREVYRRGQDPAAESPGAALTPEQVAEACARLVLDILHADLQPDYGNEVATAIRTGAWRDHLADRAPAMMASLGIAGLASTLTPAALRRNGHAVEECPAPGSVPVLMGRPMLASELMTTGDTDTDTDTDTEA